MSPLRIGRRPPPEEVICGLTRSQFEQKHVKITKCVRRPNSEERLRRLAMKDGGLLTNELRLLVWPKLLGVPFDVQAPPSVQFPTASELESHRDYRQVKLDVLRSVHRFPPGLNDRQRSAVEEQLIRVIVTVLCKNKQLYYYQGFNDICAVFLFVGGEAFAIAALEQVAKSHLKEFLKPTMERTSLILSCLYPLVGFVSARLKKHLERSEVGTTFALSWVLTWFSHDVDNVELLLRIFDINLSCHAFFPLYLSSSILLYCGNEVLCTPGDISHIHPYLSRIPTIRHLPWEVLISRASALFLRYPPSTFDRLFRSEEEQLELDREMEEGRRMAIREFKQRLFLKFRRQIKESCRSIKLWLALRGKLYEDPICTEEEDEQEEEEEEEDVDEGSSEVTANASATSPSLTFFSSSYLSSFSSSSSSLQSLVWAAIRWTVLSLFWPEEKKELRRRNDIFFIITVSLFLVVISALAYDLSSNSLCSLHWS